MHPLLRGAQFQYEMLRNQDSTGQVLLNIRLRSLKQWQVCPINLQAGRTVQLKQHDGMRSGTLRSKASDDLRIRWLTWKDSESIARQTLARCSCSG